MKFKIQQSRLELTINEKTSSTHQVIFSFDQEVLNKALALDLKKIINSVEDLSEAGNITLLTNSIDKSTLILSLGKKEQFNLNKFQNSLKSLANRLCKNNKAAAIDIILEPEVADLLNISINEYTEQTIFHLINNMYYFDEFKSTSKTLNLNKINFVIKPANKPALQNALALLEGISLIRNLGNTPPNIATPTYLAKTAQNMTKMSNKISSKILDKKELKRLGMNCFLSVSQGSEEEPKLITLTYSGGKENAKPIVLVGKGVTFDSGGLSIKPRAGMEEMKYDMMGAATVLGVFLTVAKLNLPINLVVAAPCTENLISGNAIKPSDVVTTMSGKTIEIINTDAEGRLALCDALTYVKKFDPELVIDMATLTGACITALGHVASALYSNDENLNLALQQAAKRSNDKVWPMPLFDEYEEKLKSSIADMCNIGTWNNIGGSAVAAKFLSKFVDYKWAHLDIAGTAYAGGGNYDGSNTGGATGRPFSLIIDFIRNYK